MKYFLEYTLGWKTPSNKKAEKGTIVHKALEILGHIKKAQQDGDASFDDDILGTVDIFDYDLKKIVDVCYDYYVKHSQQSWDELDRRECHRWTNKAITHKEGEFDPRNSHIIRAEQPFDFEVHKPWAMYEYDMPNGEKLEGFLSMKGTIDQISQVDDDTYLILDWKTGRRWNWAKDEEKTYAKLNNDPQLMMYYYAAQHLFPDIDHIEICIYFINDGGDFRICFSKEDIPRIEKMLQEKFEEIKNTQIPPLKKSWKCSKFCHFGKTTFEQSPVQPILERRYGEVTPIGEFMTKCEQTKYCLEHRPVDSVIKHMSSPGHDIDHYHAPGDVDTDTSNEVPDS